MGSILGGGSGGGLGGSPGGSGGGFLSSLLGGLPDPLGIGKMLGLTGQGQGQMGAPQPPPGPPPPAGAQFNGGPQASGVSVNPAQMFNSPMGPTGFGVGGGK